MEKAIMSLVGMAAIIGIIVGIVYLKKNISAECLNFPFGTACVQIIK